MCFCGNDQDYVGIIDVVQMEIEKLTGLLGRFFWNNIGIYP
jgi:hypothetical protein